jgi:putative FmdB family regulatory protein
MFIGIIRMEYDSLRFVDYKCENCGEVSEVIIRGENTSQIKCKKCGSKKMVKVFAPVGFKSDSSGDSYSSSSSCSTCSGGNCSTCSG